MNLPASKKRVLETTNEDALKEFFTCPICKDAITQPMRICSKCPHIVCLICFESLRARSIDIPKMFDTMHYDVNFNNIACPCCTATGPSFFSRKLTVPDAPLLGVLENARQVKIETKCPHCDYDAQSYLSILTTHINNCPQRPIICTLCGDGFRIDCSDAKSVKQIVKKVNTAVRAHLEKHCSGIECKHCWNRGYMCDIIQCTSIHNVATILHLQAKNMQNQMNLLKSTRKAPVHVNDESFRHLENVVHDIQMLMCALGDQTPRVCEHTDLVDGEPAYERNEEDFDSVEGDHVYDVDL